MAWEGSTRRSRLPDNWHTIRRQVLRRDKNFCQVRDAEGNLCAEKATEVDHIIPGDNHSLDNLQAICTWHHRRKSAAEGNRARKPWPSKYRKPEKHPGAL